MGRGVIRREREKWVAFLFLVNLSTWSTIQGSKWGSSGKRFLFWGDLWYNFIEGFAYHERYAVCLTMVTLLNIITLLLLTYYILTLNNYSIILNVRNPSI